MVLPFDMDEYTERLRKVKASMVRKGIDVLLVTNPANMNYLSGYDAWSFYVHQMLVVIANEERPYWIGRRMDANGAKLTTWLDDPHIFYYPDDYVQSAEKHPMDFISTLLYSWHLGHCRIGVEMDAYYFTALCYEKLVQGLPDARFYDNTILVNEVRLIKTQKEIAYMKTAARIVEKTMQTAIDSVRPGVRECDAAANIYHTQISGTGEFGGDYPAIVPLMMSGVKSSAPHLTWTEQRYNQGDLVVLELAGCYRRYHAPLARTIKLGTPTSKEQSIMDTITEGIQTALDFIRPGVTCEQIAQVWRNAIEKHGFVKSDRLGYPPGLSYPPDWGEHTASIREGDQTVLQPNMVFHFIPGIWQDDFGFEVSETFAVTETGCETLAQFPRDLFSHPSGGVPHTDAR